MHDKNRKGGKCIRETGEHLEKQEYQSRRESLVISTLLYGAESWPLSVTQMKKLEAAHHKFQRRLLGDHMEGQGQK